MTEGIKVTVYIPPNDDTYQNLIKIKHYLEEREGKLLSISDVLRKIINEFYELRVSEKNINSENKN